MTTPAARSRKVDGSISRLSPGRASNFSNIQIVDQFVPQSSAFNPHRPLPVCEFALFQALVSLSRPAAQSSAAVKSP
jgi:hypothetical protein